MQIIQAKNVFTNVSPPYVPYTDPRLSNGAQTLDKVASIEMGEGSNVFHADRQGIWLGAKKFTEAPFSVDMEGNMIAQSAIFGDVVTRTGEAQQFDGSLYIGSNKVVIDGVNGRILIIDNLGIPRILIGYDVNAP